MNRHRHSTTRFFMNIIQYYWLRTLFERTNRNNTDSEFLQVCVGFVEILQGLCELPQTYTMRVKTTIIICNLTARERESEWDSKKILLYGTKEVCCTSTQLPVVCISCCKFLYRFTSSWFCVFYCLEKRDSS